MELVSDELERKFIWFLLGISSGLFFKGVFVIEKRKENKKKGGEY